MVPSIKSTSHNSYISHPRFAHVVKLMLPAQRNVGFANKICPCHSKSIMKLKHNPSYYHPCVSYGSMHADMVEIEEWVRRKMFDDAVAATIGASALCSDSYESKIQCVALDIIRRRMYVML